MRRRHRPERAHAPHCHAALVGRPHVPGAGRRIRLRGRVRAGRVGAVGRVLGVVRRRRARAAAGGPRGCSCARAARRPADGLRVGVGSGAERKRGDDGLGGGLRETTRARAIDRASERAGGRPDLSLARSLARRRKRTSTQAPSAREVRRTSWRASSACALARAGNAEALLSAKPAQKTRLLQAGNALRVFPAVTRLTVYRRLHMIQNAQKTAPNLFWSVVSASGSR